MSAGGGGDDGHDAFDGRLGGAGPARPDGMWDGLEEFVANSPRPPREFSCHFHAIFMLLSR